MKNQLLLATFLILLSACAPLSRTQIKNTRNYFETITNFPVFFKELNNKIADINLSSAKLESALLESDSMRVRLLISSINYYEKDLELPDTILTHLKVIDNYTQNYFILIPNGFDIYRLVKGTSETIGGLFGLKGVANSILPDATISLSKAKKRKIKKHLTTSSQDVRESLKAIKFHIEEIYIPNLETIDNKSRIFLEELLLKMTYKPEPIVYYTQYNQIISNFYTRVFLTKQLSQILTNSIDLFLASESEILDKTSVRNKITTDSKNLTELIRDIQKIKLLNEKFASINLRN